MDYVPRSHDMVRKIFETQSITDILNGMLVNDKWKKWLSDQSIWISLLQDQNLKTLLFEAKIGSYSIRLNEKTRFIDGIKWADILQEIAVKSQYPTKSPEAMFMFIWTMIPHLYFRGRDALYLRRCDPTFFLSFPYEHSLFYRYSHSYTTSEMLWDHVIPEISITNLKKRNIAYMQFDYDNEKLVLREIWKSNEEDKFPKLVVMPLESQGAMILATKLKPRKPGTKIYPPCEMWFELDYADPSYPVMTCGIKQNRPEVPYTIIYSQKHVEYIIVVTTYGGRMKHWRGVVNLFCRRVNDKGVMTYFSYPIPYFSHYEGEGGRINNNIN